MTCIRSILAHSLCVLIWAFCAAVHAGSQSMGLMQLPQTDGGSTAVFYATNDAEADVKLGPFELSWAREAKPIPGNGRLIVISHGSGGSPWVHTDLARVLVQHGFVVAIPQHYRDNYLDDSEPGPASWVRRPAEISQAIDAVAAQPELASLLSLDAVGVFGGSAGGHTALTLAGGEWSSSRVRDHCEQNIEHDFSSCVGFLTLLHDDWLDGIKISLAKQIIAWRFSDETVHRYTDPRVKAAVAMVPYAADFIPESLAKPKFALALIIAAKDNNQVPRFHVEVVRRACEPRCEVILFMPESGHGAMLSPMPPLEPGSIASHLLSDPPAFDRRATIPLINERIAAFFSANLGISQ